VPSLNLTKVAFACRNLEMLQERIERRSSGREVRVATRMRPKRAPELIGGSLYWIVKHRLVARQEILRFEDREDGRIDIVCSAALVVVPPTVRRAHQGWRYFENEEGDQLHETSGVADLPPQLYGRLAALALV
jgi:hypothetical protein